MPGVPKTWAVNWGTMLLEAINLGLPESDPIKPVVNSLIDATTISPFDTTTVTRLGSSMDSREMYYKVMTQQQHHEMYRDRYKIFTTVLIHGKFLQME